jgi:ABC-type transport system substrate-binding protein
LAEKHEPGADGLSNKFALRVAKFHNGEPVTNDDFKMKAFPGYWGDKAKVSEVTLKIVPEEQTWLVQVMAGETDAATPISPVLAARLKGMSTPQVVRVPAFTNIVVYFNKFHERTGRREIRHALCMAVDRQAMLKSIMLWLRCAAGIVVHRGAAGLFARRCDPLSL